MKELNIMRYDIRNQKWGGVYPRNGRFKKGNCPNLVRRVSRVQKQRCGLDLMKPRKHIEFLFLNQAYPKIG